MLFLCVYWKFVDCYTENTKSMEFIKEVNPESVLIACLFIFLGFITIKISRLIHVQKDSLLAELIVDAAFYTIINYIVKLFLILYFLKLKLRHYVKL